MQPPSLVVSIIQPSRARMAAMRLGCLALALLAFGLVTVAQPQTRVDTFDRWSNRATLDQKTGRVDACDVNSGTLSPSGAMRQERRS